MKKNFGIRNPFLGSRNATFDYEVVTILKEREVKFTENGKVNTYPEKDIIIRSLSGNSIFCNEFLVTLSCDDAKKTLHDGEIISLHLRFSLDKGKKLVQKVTGSNLFTLHDYYQVREAESFYQGMLSKEKKINV